MSEVTSLQNVVDPQRDALLRGLAALAQGEASVRLPRNAAVDDELAQAFDAAAEANERLAAQLDRLERRNGELERERAELEQERNRAAHRLHDMLEAFAGKAQALRQPIDSMLTLAKLLADNESGNLSERQVDYAQALYSAGTSLLGAVGAMLSDARDESAVAASDARASATPIAWHLSAFRRREAAGRQPYRGHRSRRPDDGAVLIAERDASIAARLLQRVRESGYEGEVVHDLAGLRQSLGLRRPDAVVVGTALADADAWTVIRVLAADPDACRLPVGIVAMQSGCPSCLEIAGGAQAFDGLRDSAIADLRTAMAAPPAAGPTRQVGRDGLFTAQEGADAAGIATLRHGGSVEEVVGHAMRFLRGALGSALPTRRRLPSRRRRRPLDLVGKKVLVMDDDIRSVFAVTGTLEQQGMLVMHADNCEQGVALLGENPDTDAVLMDARLAGPGGEAPIGLIRARPEFESLPIVVLAKPRRPEDRDRYLQAGASDCLAKPIDDEQLVAVLRAWLLTPR